jgi:mycothiol synthase
MSSDEIQPPCLYLLWPRLKRDVAESYVAQGYALRTYCESDDRRLLELQGIDGEPMSEHAWRQYRDGLLPKGLFVMEHVTSARLVATAGAVHNPNPGRYYFPFGGEVGYLIVAPEHRRRGLGAAVCAAAVSRLLAAGYENIRVCVQEHRLPAIRTYLRLGFEPFLHSAEVEQRWQRVAALIGWRFTPELWPRHIEGTTARDLGA